MLCRSGRCLGYSFAEAILFVLIKVAFGARKLDCSCYHSVTKVDRHRLALNVRNLCTSECVRERGSGEGGGWWGRDRTRCVRGDGGSLCW